jgi:hypothetical protein
VLALLGFVSSPAAAQTAVQSGRTFYIDFASGSNSNNGTSQATPWKCHPYMQNSSGCAGAPHAYSHVAGDRFIFKGGVTWPSACLVMSVNAGGTPGAQDYYGVDQTWFSGGSFTRPKFDMQQQVPAGNHVIIGGSSTGANYVTFDNIEIANQGIHFVNPNTDFESGCGLLFNTYNQGNQENLKPALGVIVQNMYIHDWVSKDNSTANIVNDVPYCLGSVEGATVMNNTELSDEKGFVFINGNLDAEPFGNGCVYCGEVKNSKMHGGWFGCHYQSLSSPSNLSCHDSEFYHFYQNGIAGYVGQHTHIIYDNQTQTSFPSANVYNNSIHDSNAGINIWGSYESVIYNNVMWNLTNDDDILLYVPPGDSSSKVGYVLNNTVDCSSSTAPTCLSLHSTAAGGTATANALGTLNVQNNIWVTNGSPLSAILVNTSRMIKNYVMPTSEASSHGFTSANKYYPTSTDSNVNGQGVNLSSSCSGNLVPLCFDAKGAPWFGGSYSARPAASDLGAYQFGGQSTSQPTAPANLTAVVQ